VTFWELGRRKHCQGSAQSLPQLGTGSQAPPPQHPTLSGEDLGWWGGLVGEVSGCPGKVERRDREVRRGPGACWEGQRRGVCWEPTQ
jgi:hypothetical protein